MEKNTAMYCESKCRNNDTQINLRLHFSDANIDHSCSTPTVNCTFANPQD